MVLSGGDGQHFSVTTVGQTYSGCRLEIYPRLTPHCGEQNYLIQIGIRLKPYFHGCSARLCRRASDNFW